MCLGRVTGATHLQNHKKNKSPAYKNDVKIFTKNENSDINNKKLEPGYRTGTWDGKICHVYSEKCKNI